MSDQLVKEYNDLYDMLNRTISFVSGCGSRGQCYLDNAYKQLNEFCAQNPQFKCPPKPISYNDGCYGLSGALTAIAQHTP